MLTPHDIEKKMFKVSFKGYNVDEVDDFLQEVCESYAELYEEAEKFKKHNGMLSEAVGQYKSMEDTLNNALNVADMSTDEIEQDAHKRAALIIKNAENKAADIIAGAKQKLERENEKFNELQNKMNKYKDRIKDMLEAQSKILEGYSLLTSESNKPVKESSSVKEMKTENLSKVNI